MADSEAIKLLREIHSGVALLVRRANAAGNPVAAGAADDADLDGKWGDPIAKFNPRDWRGDSCKGLPFSQCPAEFLDLLAGAFDYFAKKAEESGETTTAGKPTAPYKRKDAARARGWAKRKRSGAFVDKSTGEIVDPCFGSKGLYQAFDDSASEWPVDDGGI